MPCDGKNPNCQRRRELLSQLKCLVAAMDRKKPCEWDERTHNPPPTCYPADVTHGNNKWESPSQNIPVKAVKSYELRGSTILRCECIKRNGLQDRCGFLDCMGRPECMTKLYPNCDPGRTALLKLTDFGDTQVALEKFYQADRARESALATYCRLVCPENFNGTPYNPPLFITPPSSVVPFQGSAQSFSNRSQPQFYGAPIHDQSQKFYRSPDNIQVQQQLCQSPIQMYQPQQHQPQRPQQYRQHSQHSQHSQEHHQHQQQYQRHYQQQPEQRYQEQYQQQPEQCYQGQCQQQQPMPYSYSSQASPMPYAQQCSPCMLST